MSQEKCLMFSDDHAKLLADYQAIVAKARENTLDSARGVREGSASQDGAAHALAVASGANDARRAAALLSILNRAVIVVPEKFTGAVIMGCVVALKELASGEETWYRISGAYTRELGLGTNLSPTNMAYDAPLAKQILYKRKGDTVQIIAGKKQSTYTILDVLEHLPVSETSSAA
jgi:transcription elongation GreA/GreB family factor